MNVEMKGQKRKKSVGGWGVSGLRNFRSLKGMWDSGPER